MLDTHGLQNLHLCALGPGGNYYARWLDGYWSCHATPEARKALEESHKKNWTVVTMSWGYEESYFISYGPESNLDGLGYDFDLQGFYPRLKAFLATNHGINVQVCSLWSNRIRHEP